MSTPNKYANVGGTKVEPICNCNPREGYNTECPYKRGIRITADRPVLTKDQDNNINDVNNNR